MDVHLDPRDQRKLEELSRESGKPLGEFLRELVASALRAWKKNGSEEAKDTEQETFLAAAERVGAVGCVEGGPADMSTNPKYLDGFGVS